MAAQCCIIIGNHSSHVGDVIDVRRCTGVCHRQSEICRKIGEKCGILSHWVGPLLAPWVDPLLDPLQVDHGQVMEVEEIVPQQAHSLNQGLPLVGGGGTISSSGSES